MVQLSVNRRSFLGGLVSLVGGLAIEEAIPFGRVWSFPSKIVIQTHETSLASMATIYYDRRALDILAENLHNLTPVLLSSHGSNWRQSSEGDARVQARPSSLRIKKGTSSNFS